MNRRQSRVADGSGRKCARRSMSLSCQVVREHDFALLSEQTVDVSLRGLKVHTDKIALAGESVVITMRDPRTGRYVDSDGVIARVEHGRRSRDGGKRSLGVTLRPLDADSAQRLEALMSPFRR